jgi:glutamate-1-semialdehyde 2,1-aminomutase
MRVPMQGEHTEGAPDRETSPLVGGVSSNFRINPFTKRPLYLVKADGAYVFDLAGKKYIDYFMGHGAALLGYNNPAVRSSLRAVIEHGFFSGFDTQQTIELATLLTELIPCAEQVRFANSGSEATLLALRLARGYTGKDIIIRMDGHFHGVHDYVLFNNLASLVDDVNQGDRPSRVNCFSAGIPRVIYDETVRVVPWNNLNALRRVVDEERGRVAGIIMNPIDFNNGCITTTREYLSGVNEIARKRGIVVIYDEILSGFRVGIECAQGYYGVTPDICTLSKALSNGVPLSAIVGRAEIMSRIVDGDLPVVHGGTFSGSPFGVAAALATLKTMSKPFFFTELFGVSNFFFEEMQKLFDREKFPAVVQHAGCSFYIYFGVTEPITSYRQMRSLDWELARKFYSRCIERGLYFHTDFTVSASHTRDDIMETIDVMGSVVRGLKN